MAIDPTTITSDLTLELDEAEVSVADFSQAFTHFVGLVREIARWAAPDKNPNAWSVQVYPGSAGVGLTPQTTTYLAGERAAIRAQCLNGLRQLERGEQPNTFSDKAIEHSRELAKMRSVRVWSDRETSYVIPSSVALHASEILDADSESHGSVDGTLEKLSVHGGCGFVIYDFLHGFSIKCEVGEDLLRQALALFGQRVEVLGLVHYRKDGRPASVKATKIIPFPKSEDIPSLDEMREIFA
jgi:hypothetical protein